MKFAISLSCLLLLTLVSSQSFLAPLPNRINSSINVNEIESEAIQSSSIFAISVNAQTLKTSHIQNGDSQITLTSQGSVLITPKVTALYYISNNKPISPTQNALIIYDLNNTDTHSAYNLSNGVYTIPVAGVYSINAHLESFWASGWNVGTSFRLYIVIKGSIGGTFALGVGDQMPYPEIGFRSAGGTFIMSFEKGDAFHIESEVYSGDSKYSTSGDQTHSFLLINKII